MMKVFVRTCTWSLHGDFFSLKRFFPKSQDTMGNGVFLLRKCASKTFPRPHFLEAFLSAFGAKNRGESLLPTAAAATNTTTNPNSFLSPSILRVSTPQNCAHFRKRRRGRERRGRKNEGGGWGFVCVAAWNSGCSCCPKGKHSPLNCH